MDKTDRNSAEDFCHPPGAVCTGGKLTRETNFSMQWYNGKKADTI